jgi:transposase InsO family protein
MQNGFVESFNGRLRDECLNEHVFTNLGEAREDRLQHQSTAHEPQWLTPTEFAARPDQGHNRATAAFGARRFYLDSVIFLSLENCRREFDNKASSACL